MTDENDASSGSHRDLPEQKREGIFEPTNPADTRGCSNPGKLLSEQNVRTIYAGILRCHREGKNAIRMLAHDQESATDSSTTDELDKLSSAPRSAFSRIVSFFLFLNRISTQIFVSAFAFFVLAILPAAFFHFTSGKLPTLAILSAKVGLFAVYGAYSIVIISFVVSVLNLLFVASSAAYDIRLARARGISEARMLNELAAFSRRTCDDRRGTELRFVSDSLTFAKADFEGWHTYILKVFAPIFGLCITLLATLATKDWAQVGPPVAAWLQSQNGTTYLEAFGSALLFSILFVMSVTYGRRQDLGRIITLLNFAQNGAADSPEPKSELPDKSNENNWTDQVIKALESAVGKVSEQKESDKIS